VLLGDVPHDACLHGILTVCGILRYVRAPLALGKA